MLAGIIFIVKFIGNILKWLALLVVASVGLSLLFWAVPYAISYLGLIPRPFSDFVILAVVICVVKVVLKR